MRTKISSMLDAVADRLEAKGLVKEAFEIDKVADEVEVRPIEAETDYGDEGPDPRDTYGPEIDTGKRKVTLTFTEKELFWMAGAFDLAYDHGTDASMKRWYKSMAEGLRKKATI